MKTNRFYTFLFVLVLVSMLAACANQAGQPESTPDVVVEVVQTEPPAATEEPAAAAATEEPAGDGTEVVTVLEAITLPIENVPSLIEGNPPTNFGALGDLYMRQVMEDVVNYRVAGAVMEYSCPADGHVFLSTDPGKFMDTAVPNGGVVAYPCEEGDKVTFSTPHFSQGTDSHQQVTVNFVPNPFPKFQGDPTWGPRDALILWKDNEGKDKAYFFSADGEVEVIE